MLLTVPQCQHRGVRSVDITRDWLAAQVAAGRTDTEIATDAGCSTTTVRLYRRRHQLPAATQHAVPAGAERRRLS